MTEIAPETQSQYMLDVTQPSTTTPEDEFDNFTPQLIDFPQWVSCFTQNNSDDVFALYTSYHNGQAHDVRLKCGTHDPETSNGWGYKHIRSGHESTWQKHLNAARENGWNVGPIANGGSWDDMMSALTGETIAFPEYVNDSGSNKTRCVNAEFFFGDVQTGEITYSMRVTAVFALNNDRLITSYPTTKTTC